MNPKLLAIRQRIEHEDNLLNQRLSSLLSSQSFLLTAFAISLNGPREFERPSYQIANHLLTHYLPWIGLGCIITLGLSMAGAMLSLARLRRMAAEFAGPDDMPVMSTPLIRALGSSPALLVPAFFLVLWMILLPIGRP